MLDQSSPFSVARPPGPQSKNEVALARLRHALLACEIQPGSHFAEAELEARYHLSRASIRVALASLAADGLVKSQPRQGWQAVPVTGDLIGNLLLTRRRIEPLLLVEAPSAHAIERLDALATFNAAIVGRSDAQSLLTARTTDRQILSLLAENTGFFVRKWLSEIWDHSARVVCFLERSANSFCATDRRPLVGALRERDGSGATAELLVDIDRFQDFVSGALLRLRLPLLDEPEGKSVRRTARRASQDGTSAPHPDHSARPHQTRGRTT